MSKLLSTHVFSKLALAKSLEFGREKSRRKCFWVEILWIFVVLWDSRWAASELGLGRELAEKSNEARAGQILSDIRSPAAARPELGRGPGSAPHSTGMDLLFEDLGLREWIQAPGKLIILSARTSSGDRSFWV